MTTKKLKSIDIINVLSDLVSEKMETTVKLPELNLEYHLEGIDPPTNERVENANKILHTDKYK